MVKRIFLCLLVMSSACGEPPVGDVQSSKKQSIDYNSLSYLKDIAPIFAEACGSCHAPGKSQERFPLTNQIAVASAREGIFLRLHSPDPAKVMPPSGKVVVNGSQAQVLPLTQGVLGQQQTSQTIQSTQATQTTQAGGVQPVPPVQLPSGPSGQKQVDFKDSESGKKLLFWLCNSPEARSKTDVIVCGKQVTPAQAPTQTQANSQANKGNSANSTPGGNASGSIGNTQNTGNAGGIPNLNASDFKSKDYSSVQSLLTQHCSGCHTAGAIGSAQILLGSQQDWLKVGARQKILNRLESGSMPMGAGGNAPNNLIFLNSEAGKQIYGWLRFGKEFSGN
jgi:mono/diheme cytochrome c family protein